MLCSVSMVFGVLGALVIGKMIARRRFGRSGRCGGGGRGFGKRGFGGPLGWFLRRLSATPAQEKEVRTAVQEAREEMQRAKAHAAEARGDLAASMSGDVFDDDAFARASARVNDATDRVRDAVRTALSRVHATLDPEQRKRLVEMLERGGGFGRGGLGPYRGGASL